MDHTKQAAYNNTKYDHTIGSADGIGDVFQGQRPDIRDAGVA